MPTLGFIGKADVAKPHILRDGNSWEKHFLEDFPKKTPLYRYMSPPRQLWWNPMAAHPGFPAKKYTKVKLHFYRPHFCPVASEARQ